MRPNVPRSVILLVSVTLKTAQLVAPVQITMRRPARRESSLSKRETLETGIHCILSSTTHETRAQRLPKPGNHNVLMWYVHLYRRRCSFLTVSQGRVVARSPKSLVFGAPLRPPTYISHLNIPFPGKVLSSSPPSYLHIISVHPPTQSPTRTRTRESNFPHYVIAQLQDKIDFVRRLCNHVTNWEIHRSSPISQEDSLPA